MKRGRLGHFILGGLMLFVFGQSIDRALRSPLLAIRVLSWIFAGFVLVVLVVPMFRNAFAKTKPVSAWEGFTVMGADRKKRAMDLMREFVDPDERVEVAATSMLGAGALGRFRWVGLTDRRFVALKSSPRGWPSLAIDFSEPRANMRVISHGPDDSRWEITMARGAAPPQRYRFHPRFAEQGRQIAEALSASGPASTTPS